MLSESGVNSRGESFTCLEYGLRRRGETVIEPRYRSGTQSTAICTDRKAILASLRLRIIII